MLAARAGYYSRAWQWEKIKANAQWITQFHSTDDPFIPPAESRHVAQSLRLQVSRHDDQYRWESSGLHSSQDASDIVAGRRASTTTSEQQQRLTLACMLVPRVSWVSGG